SVNEPRAGPGQELSAELRHARASTPRSSPRPSVAGATTPGTTTIPPGSLCQRPRPHRLDWPWSRCRRSERDADPFEGERLRLPAARAGTEPGPVLWDREPSA